MNEMLTNKQTNKQTRIEITTLWLPDTPENRELLKRAHELRSKDKWTITRLVRVAFAEYVNRHHPGNPTPPLTSFFPGGPPLSEAAQEKLRPPSPPAPSRLDTYELRCHICGQFFTSTEDLELCPKCAKPEATT